MNRYSRRRFVNKFVQHVSFGTFAFPSLASFYACESVKSKESNRAEQEQLSDSKNLDKLGVALVGLGAYSTEQLSHALQETEYCYLAGIVTGTPAKADQWKKKFQIPEKNIYNYIDFDNIRNNPNIDIVYVVLPNAMHREYVVRAAAAGKHVICEKPMALTIDECDEMIDACKNANRMLSMGYRLHFEPYNREMMRLGQKKVFGKVNKIIAENGLANVSGWRLDKQLAGGGPLMDVGIYCVQASRYISGLEPIAVRAKQGPKKDERKFNEVEESLSWQLEFPDGAIAECKTSYSESLNFLRAEAEKGWFELSPAFSYSGIKGRTSEGKMEFPNVSQQARQLDDFALAILNDRPTSVPGEMGRQDVKILQAIYQAMKTGKRVTID